MSTNYRIQIFTFLMSLFMRIIHFCPTHDTVNCICDKKCVCWRCVYFQQIRKCCRMSVCERYSTPPWGALLFISRLIFFLIFLSPFRIVNALFEKRQSSKVCSWRWKLRCDKGHGFSIIISPLLFSSSSSYIPAAAHPTNHNSQIKSERWERACDEKLAERLCALSLYYFLK